MCAPPPRVVPANRLLDEVGLILTEFLVRGKKGEEGKFQRDFFNISFAEERNFLCGGKRGVVGHSKMSFKGVWQHRLMTFFGIRGGNEELEGITEAKRVSAG